MDVYFVSILIVGGIIFLKLLIIICAYGCRMKRLRDQQARLESGNSGEQSYPSQPYNSRSPIVNFEETPQHIYTVPPGTEGGRVPTLTPPPYAVAGGDEYKPPAYEQVFSGQESLQPGDAEGVQAGLPGGEVPRVCETGEESRPGPAPSASGVTSNLSRVVTSIPASGMTSNPASGVMTSNTAPPPYAENS